MSCITEKDLDNLTSELTKGIVDGVHNVMDQKWQGFCIKTYLKENIKLFLRAKQNEMYEDLENEHLN